MRNDFQAYISLAKTAASAMLQTKKATATLSDMESMKKAKEKSGIKGRAVFNLA